MGEELAKETDVEADLVVPVPDSGVPAALGYSQYSKKSFELGLIRNHYVGRTFIEPTQQIRQLGVKLKHNPNASLVKRDRGHYRTTGFSLTRPESPALPKWWQTKSRWF